MVMVPIRSSHASHIRIRSHKPLRRAVKMWMLRICRHTNEQPLRLPIMIRAEVRVGRNVVRLPLPSGPFVDDGPPTIPIPLGSVVERQIVQIPKHGNRAWKVNKIAHPSKSDDVPHRFGGKLGQTDVVRHQELGNEGIQRKAETVLQMMSIHRDEPPRRMSHPRTLLIGKFTPVPQGMLDSV